MGFWIGTLVFACLEVVGFLGIEATLSTRYRNSRAQISRLQKSKNTLLPQVLLATAVGCCWMMWAIVFIGQMYPLVNPVLSG